MLKKISKLFLGLVVCTSSACVTPTHASSAPTVIFSHVQAGGVASAKEEAIVLYNSTSADIVITNWCVVNKLNVSFACFTHETETGTLAYTLPAYSYASIVSKEYAARAQLPEASYSLVYTPASSSSGSITGSAESLSLINSEAEVVDTNAWSTSLAAGKSLSRLKVMTNPDMYAATGSPADWMIDTKLDKPVNNVAVVEIPISQPEPPETPPDPEEGPTQAPPATIAPVLFITEIFPNPAGADAGEEFIELFNSHETEVAYLKNIRVRIGTDTPKWYSFPDDTLQPGEYKAYYNKNSNFTLVNTASRVQLFNGTEPIGDPVEYISPEEGQSWSLVDDTWAYSAPSPSAANTLSEIVESKPDETLATPANAIQKPCAANQFRNPETGRCKLLAAKEQSTAACKAGQERNPETGRCRNIAAVKGTTACKEGQERNPETNRCRNIIKMMKATHGLEIKEGGDNQPKWYYWMSLGLLIIGVAGYATWEWREELTGIWSRARSLLTK